MTNAAASSTSEADRPSDTVLDETPLRVVAFLRAVARHPEIFTTLYDAGYRVSDQEDGWRLLRAACGEPVLGSRRVANAPVDAAASIKEWFADASTRIDAALARLHPSVHRLLFQHVELHDPIVGAGRLLRGLDDLERGPARERLGDDARLAMETLERRGFHAAERARIAKLIEVAMGLGARADAPPPPPDPDRRADVALYRWFKDWSTTSRTVIKSRAHLISLGLSKRKPKPASTRKPSKKKRA